MRLLHCGNQVYQQQSPRRSNLDLSSFISDSSSSSLGSSSPEKLSNEKLPNEKLPGEKLSDETENEVPIENNANNSNNFGPEVQSEFHSGEQPEVATEVGHGNNEMESFQFDFSSFAEIDDVTDHAIATATGGEELPKAEIILPQLEEIIITDPPLTDDVTAYDVTNNDVISASETSNPGQCLVCHSKATSKNYGAFTCSTCKNAFKRTWLTKPKLECKNDSYHCDMSSDGHRKRTGPGQTCRWCRLKKCFDVGMTMKGFLQKRKQGGIQPKPKPMTRHEVDQILYHGIYDINEGKIEDETAQVAVDEASVQVETKKVDLDVSHDTEMAVKALIESNRYDLIPDSQSKTRQNTRQSARQPIKTPDISVKIPEESLKCVGCNVPVKQNVYGVPGCGSCRGFFRRVWLAKQVFQCEKAGVASNCDASSCKYCRLKRCLTNGMSMKSIILKKQLTHHEPMTQHQIDLILNGNFEELKKDILSSNESKPKNEERPSEEPESVDPCSNKRKRTADDDEIFANNNFVHSTPKKRKTVAEEPVVEKTPTQMENDEGHVTLRPCSVCNRRNRTVSNHNGLFACSRCSNLLNQAQRALDVDTASFQE